MQRPALSLIIPVYNEEAIIEELDRRLKAFLGEIAETWEVVFVDDGSHDRTLAALSELAAAEPRYKVITFSRNFGHQIAITAGMDRAEGDAVVIMDADLQDPPEVVNDMIEKWREGYDVVYGQRSIRHGESFFKRATAAAFYRLLRALMPIEIPLDTGDFRLMSRSVVLSSAIRAARALCRRNEIPTSQDGALRGRRHHLAFNRSASDRHLARAAVGLGCNRHLSLGALRRAYGPDGSRLG